MVPMDAVPWLRWRMMQEDDRPITIDDEEWGPYWVYKSLDDETPRQISRKFNVELSEVISL